MFIKIITRIYFITNNLLIIDTLKHQNFQDIAKFIDLSVKNL